MNTRLYISQPDPVEFKNRDLDQYIQANGADGVATYEPCDNEDTAEWFVWDALP